jgi:hypothetical protein
MPAVGSSAMMDVIEARTVVHDPGGARIGTSRCEMEVNQVATVQEQTSGGYQVTVNRAELALLRSALDEAERVSRFGMEVLDGVDRSPDRKSSEDSRLLREMDALAMREAMLRSLQTTMWGVDGGGKLSPTQHAGPGQVSSGAVLRVPPPRGRPFA